MADLQSSYRLGSSRSHTNQPSILCLVARKGKLNIGINTGILNNVPNYGLLRHISSFAANSPTEVTRGSNAVGTDET